MQKFTLITILISFYFLNVAQTPQLVADFNSGTADGFNVWNYKGIHYKDMLIFPLISENSGEELGILKDGQMSILKDINPGSESSRPNSFILYKDKIYFAADDAKGGGLWETDGTVENTKLLFSLSKQGISPGGLIVSDSGWLYYTYNENLYRTDGVQNEMIFSKVKFYTSDVQQSNNYTKFKDGIAFAILDINVVKLYQVQDNNVVLLATTGTTSSFPYIYGLSEVDQGLVFSIDDSFKPDAQGTYFYNTVSKNLEKIEVAGDYASRLHPFDRKSALGWVRGSGYYMINGKSSQDQQLFASTNTSFLQGASVLNGVFNDKLVFQGSEGFFGNDYLFYSDGTKAGTKKLFQISEYVSNILMYNNYAFIASGTSNGFKPAMYFVNLYDGTYKNFYNYTLSSINSKSILILGLIGNKLYYISNLDATKGRELYYITIDINTNVTDVQQNDYNLEIINGSYKIVSPDLSLVKVQFTTMDGRVMSSEFISTNTENELPNQNGIMIISLSNGKQVKSFKFYKN